MDFADNVFKCKSCGKEMDKGDAWAKTGWLHVDRAHMTMGRDSKGFATYATTDGLFCSTECLGDMLAVEESKIAKIVKTKSKVVKKKTKVDDEKADDGKG